MRPLHAVVVGALGLALVAAGCGGAIPSSDGGPAALKLDGRYLVDSQGHSVYLFEKDEDGESYCSGACAAVWPPLETSTAPRGGAGVQEAELGTIERPDGDMQVTYHGHPLYFFVNDKKAGATGGEGLKAFGGKWYALSPAGVKIVSAPMSTTTTTPTTTTTGGYGGGGYG